MKTAIVLGGGAGTRAGGLVPKQFQKLDEYTVLEHSIQAMRSGGADLIIVVLHPDFLREWTEKIPQYGFPCLLVTGGETRWHSVRNALSKIKEHAQISRKDLIAVHDAARPLVPVSVVEQGWEVAARHRSAIPVIPVTDSLRFISNMQENSAVDRSHYHAVQTPQIFEASLILDAYNCEYSAEFTDDASVVEKNGIKIRLFPGSPENIKITNPLDLEIAKTILKHRQ